MMPELEDPLRQKASEVLYEFDQVLQADIWQDSLFLKGVASQLQDLRDQLAGQLRINAEYGAEQISAQASRTEVYIALYQTQGNDLLWWERTIHNLLEHYITRPVYACEKIARSVVMNQSKQPHCHAYLAVHVEEKAILKNIGPYETLVDQQGRQRISLKEGSIQFENIKRFVHLSGEYQWKNSSLVPIKPLPER